MPISKTWGPLTVSRAPIATNDASLTARDKEKVYGISVFDCFPSPGSTSNFVRPKAIGSSVIPGSLQQVENSRLAKLPTLNGGQAQNSKAVLEQIKTHMSFRNHAIDYSGEDYEALREIHDCYTSRLFLRVYFDISKIEITSNRKTSLGAETFSAGDAIATFRMKQPIRHRFEVHHIWNALCCPNKPAVNKESEIADDLYAIEEIIVTSERIRRLQLESAKPISPFTLEDFLQDE